MTRTTNGRTAGLWLKIVGIRPSANAALQAHEADRARMHSFRLEGRYPGGVVGRIPFARCSLCANPLGVRVTGAP
jgi:hypothetical protein